MRRPPWERRERQAWLFIGALSVAVVFAIGLGGCAGRVPPIAREPIIRTVEVRVPVPQPCPMLDRLGPAPVYPDTAEALHGAPNLFERVKLLVAGRALRIGREAALIGAAQACGSATEAPLQRR